MSDGASEIARDQDRHSAYERYLAALADWYVLRTDESLVALRAAAEATDSIRGGYSTGSTKLAARLDRLLQSLAEGNLTAWGRLLLGAASYLEVSERLRSLSPFGDRILVLADYGLGFVHLRGEIEAAVAAKIREAGGSPYAGEDYIIALPREALQGATVVPLQPPRKPANAAASRQDKE